MQPYDAVIVGGSLAGSTAGILLADEGWKVLIVDKAAFPRDKVCGEFLSPAIWPLLKKLRLEEILRSQNGTPIHRVRFLSSHRSSVFPLPYNGGYGISRLCLDQIFQQEAICRGCQILNEHEVIEINSSKFPYHLLVRDKKSRSTRSMEAICVINASGALNRWGSRTPSRQKKMGFKARFTAAASEPSVDIYFFKGGYLGICGIEKGAYNLCAWMDSERFKNGRVSTDLFLQEIASENRSLKLWLSAAKRDNDWLFTGSISLGLRRSHQDQYSIGDACGFIEPFLGQGMTFAVLSGFYLHQYLLRKSASPERFAHSMKSLYSKRLTFSRIFHWLSERPELLELSLRRFNWLWRAAISTICSPVSV